MTRNSIYNHCIFSVVNLTIVTAARAFVVTEANRISMEDNSLKRNFNYLKTIILHFTRINNHKQFIFFIIKKDMIETKKWTTRRKATKTIKPQAHLFIKTTKITNFMH